jgi:chromosome segregation ATPase
VLYNFIFFLAFIGAAEASIENDLIAPFMKNQIVDGPPIYSSNPNLYINAIREKNFYLQKSNAELIRQVKALQIYRSQTVNLQQRLENLEQEFSAIDEQNQDLQNQVDQNEAQIKWLNKKQAAYIQELQESKNKLKIQTDDFQKLQTSLKNCEQELLAAKQKPDQLPPQSNTKEVIWLNGQIQANNKKINELNQQIGVFSRQNYDLNLAKAIAEQKLQEITKRLDSCEKTHVQSSKDSKENETRLQSTIDEKTASIAKWKQDYDSLKSQLDKAVSINNELRQQITQLEAECKRSNARTP